MGASKITVGVFIALACIFIVGSLYRASLRKLDGLYALSYCAIVILWPAPSEMQRFVFVIIPIFIFQGYFLLNTAAERWWPARSNIVPSLYIIAIAILALPYLALTTTRYFSHSVPTELEAYRPTARWYGWFVWRDSSERIRDMLLVKSIAEGLSAATQRIPDNECVYSVKTSYVHFYTRRISKAPPAETANPAEVYAALRNGSCNYFFLTYLVSSGISDRRFYPQHIIANDIETISEMWVIDKDEKIPVGIVAKWK